ANALVVTAATAARYGLRSIANLARVAPSLMFGGPPECPGRAYCLPGLKRVYGLRFKAFTPLDAGGPLTLQALQAGYIGAALLFTTDPAIPARHLVVLADDRELQPAENITPLVSREAIVRYGPRLLATLNKVPAILVALGLAGAVVATQLAPWLRIDDRASTWVLRSLAGIRTPWLTDVANAIKAAGTGWGVTVLGLSVVALIMAFRRWRHLLVFMG